LTHFIVKNYLAILAYLAESGWLKRGLNGLDQACRSEKQALKVELKFTASACYSVCV
jgi:hypothetical protein